MAGGKARSVRRVLFVTPPCASTYGHAVQALLMKSMKSNLIEARLAWARVHSIRTSGIRSLLNSQLDMYSLLCFVRGDLSRVPKLPRASSFSREKYYAATFDVVLSLGLTETKAHVCWMENVSYNLWNTRYYFNVRFSFLGRRKEVRLLR
jgi:hypothetical protein